MKSEIKGNVQGAKETRTEINDLDQKEEINTQPEQNEETRIQKNERLRNLQENFKGSNIQIMGVPEGEEEEQKMENLFEQVVKENFPIWQRRLTSRKSRKLRVPKKLDPRKHTPGTS